MPVCLSVSLSVCLYGWLDGRMGRWMDANVNARTCMCVCMHARKRTAYTKTLYESSRDYNVLISLWYFLVLSPTPVVRAVIKWLVIVILRQQTWAPPINNWTHQTLTSATWAPSINNRAHQTLVWHERYLSAIGHTKHLLLRIVPPRWHPFLFSVWL